MVIDIEMCLHSLSNDSPSASRPHTLQCCRDDPQWAVKGGHLFSQHPDTLSQISKINNTGVNLAWPSSCVSSKKICSTAGNYVSCFIRTTVFMIDWRRNIGTKENLKLLIELLYRSASRRLAVIKCHWKDYWLLYCRSHKMTFRQSIGNMKTSCSWGGHIPASVNKNWPSRGESTCSLGWQVTFYRRLLQLWYRISQINVQRIVFHFLPRDAWKLINNIKYCFLCISVWRAW